MNASNQTVSGNLRGTFSPIMRKLMEDNASTFDKQHHDSVDSGISLYSDVSSSTSGHDRVIKEKMTENANKQQDNHKVEASKKTYNPLDWNPIYQGKKRFGLDNMSSSASSCSEKSNISDISDKSNNSNIVRCNITRSNSEKDLRKPDVTHDDKPADKKLSNVSVSELIRKFEQGTKTIKGR
ncbi:hypothetical protein [Wolbachia endosymbiont of Ctenocephalides felis wCfeJ]|uniref:hypothetical protein n=1 Tax=Wolbachia endosymbiont of Ctenocephalides felis wCfeJ TaxID=2732594 RepID=UPI001FEAF827|nr:hypothetical protein [Wolbachia endosymbiont of Ctenocephalides felis wCfeJ]WCR57608.1 MAG: hypothetical protein PG980_000080 [Wolbachia endosymbiont of Ctenocephalides felis wCfeJ]